LGALGLVLSSVGVAGQGDRSAGPGAA
jgi:hypothetical protein